MHVGLHQAGIVGHMMLRMLAAAVARVEEGGGRRVRVCCNATYRTNRGCRTRLAIKPLRLVYAGQ